VKKEAVLAAFGHRKAERLPYHIEMTSPLAHALRGRLGMGEGEFKTWIGNFCGKADIAEQGAVNGRGFHQDDFGVQWDRTGADKDIGTIVDPLLPEPDFGSYCFPQPDLVRARRQVEDSLASPEDRALFAKIGMTLFERAWSLTGFENFLLFLAAEQDFAREVLRRVCGHRLALVQAVLDLPFQGFYFGDDYGQQSGTLFSPQTFRTLIKPELARLIEPIKRAGKLVVLHSCGNIDTFLDDLIEIGLDGYQTVQPEAYDFAALKRRYGSRLTFWGGISTQTTLPFGTVDEVLRATRSAVDILGAGGGYIAGPTHRITSDTPMENVIALVAALQGRSTGKERL